MDDCCASCKWCIKLEKMDFSKGGCEHTDMEGFACMAFEDEGIANWIVGLDKNSGLCECYTERVNSYRIIR